MPNTWRPPQPGDPGYGLIGQGSPVGPAHGQRRAEALRGLCLELVGRADRENWQSWQGACKDGAPKLVAHAEELVQPPSALLAELKKLVGQCDLMFRTSSQHQITWSRQLWGPEGAPAVRTTFFQDACSCLVVTPTTGFMPDLEENVDEVLFHQQFQAFTEAACGKHIPEDAYGSPGNVLRLKVEAQSANNAVARATEELVNEIMISNVVTTRSNMNSFQEVLDAVGSYVSNVFNPSTQHGFRQRMEGRALAVKSVRSIVKQLRARVQAHIQKRRREDRHFLEEAEDDVLAVVAGFLTAPAAACLLQTCRQFSRAEALRNCMPHLHVREVVGTFPHHRVLSFDRSDLAQGQKHARMRDFIVASKVLHLYVDFVMPTRRAVPLKKKLRTDGLDNRDYDFSDDEFEDAPERMCIRGPPVEPNNHAEGSVWWLRRQRMEKQKRSAWELAEGPAEPVDRYRYLQRIPYCKYFTAPLKMTVSLVYADDHSAVSCIRSKNALDMSNQAVRDEGVFAQPFKYAVYDAPAHAKFHVRHLTLDHGGRLFKLRIEATGNLNGERGGRAVQWILFTKPFEVVSKASVVKKAPKRRTERERQAGIRATKDAKRART